MASKEEAAAMLEAAERAQRKVGSRAAKEEWVFAAWALYFVVMLPGYDRFGAGTWGWVVLAVAVALSLTTAAYFNRRSREVRAPGRAPGWAWACLTIGGVAGAVVAAVSGSFTGAGVVAAIPAAGAALWVRRSR